MAPNLDNQGHYEEAEPLYRKAVKLIEEVLGSNHPTSKIIRGNLTELLKKL